MLPPRYGYLLLAIVGLHPHVRPYYIARDGHWTGDPEEAAVYPTEWAAAEYATTHKLPTAVAVRVELPRTTEDKS